MHSKLLADGSSLLFKAVLEFSSDNWNLLYRCIFSVIEGRLRPSRGTSALMLAHAFDACWFLPLVCTWLTFVVAPETSDAFWCSMTFGTFLAFVGNEWFIFILLVHSIPRLAFSLGLGLAWGLFCSTFCELLFEDTADIHQASKLFVPLIEWLRIDILPFGRALKSMFSVELAS